ncbi:basic proline-rich protein-like [Iris pallida]|uniref:Basic proline-rich protein-like n=1 Tax=Iris pallida TaxID=29817 RepID=A0AAX6FGD5_IRIPA|nr:basic proline-rich protein-like [Iris pallida]
MVGSARDATVETLDSDETRVTTAVLVSAAGRYMVT